MYYLNGKRILNSMKEFDWLAQCTSCNIECCHNIDKNIPENECSRQEYEKGSTVRQIDIHQENINQDYRPLECRLFPFDVKEINEKLTWIKWNNCHTTPELNYGKFIDFFERKFSRELSLDQIQQYVEQRKIIGPDKYSTNKYTVIRELKWPN
jgi:hypothetical protein